MAINAPDPWVYPKRTEEMKQIVKNIHGSSFSHSISKMKYLLIIAGTLIFLASIVGFFSWSSGKWNITFGTPMLLKECRPEEIIKEIKDTSGIEIPKLANKMLAAINIGSWDSSEQDFVFKFNVRSDQIENFIKSLPEEVSPNEYRIENDLRGVKELGQPLWFLGPIPKGIIIEGITAYKKLGAIELMYIDTSNSDETIVYILGSYRRVMEK